MLGPEVICSIINDFCCVKVVFSQCRRAGSLCLGCTKRFSVFCKDTEAVHSTLFEYTVLDYKYLMWCIITFVTMMSHIHSFWIKKITEYWAVSFHSWTTFKCNNNAGVTVFIGLLHWIAFNCMAASRTLWISTIAEHYPLVVSLCMCPSTQRNMERAAWK